MKEFCSYYVYPYWQLVNGGYLSNTLSKQCFYDKNFLSGNKNIGRWKLSSEETELWSFGKRKIARRYKAIFSWQRAIYTN